jgi:hypothetical protein
MTKVEAVVIRERTLHGGTHGSPVCPLLSEEAA